MSLKQRKKAFLYLFLTLLLTLLFLNVAHAATIKGTIYNQKLSVEKDVLVEINTTTLQKYLAKEGTYVFELPSGKYDLSAKKGELTTHETVIIAQQGIYLYDLFLIPDFSQEEELWTQTEEKFLEEEEEKTMWWRYAVAGFIALFAIYRIIKVRRKYGSLRSFRQKVQEENNKTLEQHKEEINREPSYLDKTIEIIKKHDRRIHQKTLRKELLPLSEAKVSLILTELEHKGLIEKIKKGRGNVIILK